MVKSKSLDLMINYQINVKFSIPSCDSRITILNSILQFSIPCSDSRITILHSRITIFNSILQFSIPCNDSRITILHSQITILHSILRFSNYNSPGTYSIPLTPKKKADLFQSQPHYSLSNYSIITFIDCFSVSLSKYPK